MKYLPIDNSLFVSNRDKFKSLLKPSSVAIFHSNDEMPRNGDQAHSFRQNSDFFYLCGIDQEDSILVIFPDAPKESNREMLFLKKTNEHIRIWEGHKYTKEEALKASGITSIYWIDEFKSILAGIMNHAEHCYLNLNENDRASNPVPYRDLRFAEEMKRQFPLHIYMRSAPLMAGLRVIKSDPEIELLRKACNITDEAFREILAVLKPGMMEFEVEAQMSYSFLKRRATGHAYHPIVASGASACILHYQDNNRECMDGDLLLMDFGAEYANYNADLTRTIPVNGKFSPRQREVYQAVLNVFKTARSMMVPGHTLDQFNQEVGKVMESELIRIGLLDKTEVEKQDKSAPLYKKYFMHGTAHFLGLDVHDIGDRYKPIEEGMVLTCEPGIYIREEGLGIRIENDILVTNHGPVDLMASIPIEADEIEELMNS